MLVCMVFYLKNDYLCQLLFSCTTKPSNWLQWKWVKTNVALYKREGLNDETEEQKLPLKRKLHLLEKSQSPEIWTYIINVIINSKVLQSEPSGSSGWKQTPWLCVRITVDSDAKTKLTPVWSQGEAQVFLRLDPHTVSHGHALIKDEPRHVTDVMYTYV